MDQPAPEPATEMATADEYGPVSAGDTLWGIANRYSSAADGSIYSTMIAILRANPDAFIDGNINRLKRGEILKLPSEDELAAVDLGAATSEYRSQLEEYEAFRAAVAGMAPKVDVVADEGIATDQADSMTTPTVATDTAAQQDQTQDQLKIAGVTDQGQGGAGSGEMVAEVERLQEKITNLEEDLLSSDRENRELQDKVNLLEDQIKNAQRLLELKDQELALAQQNAATGQAAAGQAAADKAAADKVAADKAAADKAAADKAAADKAVADKAVADKAVADKAAADKAAADKAKPKPKPVVTAPESVSWWKSLLATFGGGWVLPVIGGLVAVVIGILGLVFFRRRRSLAEFEESILSGSALAATSETSQASAKSSSGSTDTSFLSDFGVPGMGTMQADEVDPIAEAEVYMAYGRDEQAEEVLREAMIKDPTRQELKLKVLEIYEQRGDVKAFETLSEELYPAQGADKASSETWARVVEMGQRVNPGNPLFKGGAAAVAATIVTTTDDAESMRSMMEGAATAETAADDATDDGVEFATELMDKGDADDSADDQALFDLEASTVELDSSIGDIDQVTGGSMAETEVDSRLSPIAEDDLLASTAVATTAAVTAAAPGADESMLDAFPTPDLDGVSEIAGAMDSGLGGVEAAAASSDGEVDLDFDLGLDGIDDNPLAGGDDAAEVPLMGSTDDEGIAFEIDDASSVATGFETAISEITEGDAPDALSDDSVDMDFDLELDSQPMNTEELVTDLHTASSLVDADSGSNGDAQLSVVDVDMAEMTDTDSESDDEAQWDEAATKLDLAKAYIDMGDASGAKSIIEEVLKEGNDGQRKQAEELSAQLNAA
jgi:pilus assembly protein FimV